MLEKLADALAAANDWPAACDSLLQLRKLGTLSKHAQQLWHRLSEQDAAHDAAQTESDSSYLAGSFKRRKVEHVTSGMEPAGPAELVLPANDWPQLLTCLTQHLQVHLASGKYISYTIRLSTMPHGSAPEASQEVLHPEPSVPASLAAEPSSSTRPQSAKSLPLGCEEDLVQQGAETASQDCSERTSKRIASRRCVERIPTAPLPHWHSSQKFRTLCNGSFVDQQEAVLHPIHASLQRIKSYEVMWQHVYLLFPTHYIGLGRNASSAPGACSLPPCGHLLNMTVPVTSS